VAQEWASKFHYPLDDRRDLVRVAEFLAVKHDPMFPKEQFLEDYLRRKKLPDFGQADEPHCLLADLPLPVYITTNYDDFMVRALRARGKQPERELLKWNSYTKGKDSVFDAEPSYEPAKDRPVVFHFHGHDEISESLVLTEDDYLDLLVNISQDPTLIPPLIQQAMANTSLIFIGYSLNDWSFRVIFRRVLQSVDDSLRRISVTVQLPLEDAVSPVGEEAQKYLDRYYEKMNIQVYWGTARQFVAELGQRWKVFCSE
jgi:hypothetical protein